MSSLLLAPVAAASVLCGGGRAAVDARSLLGFLAAQRTLGTNLYWNGPANDPLLMFIPEHHPVIQSSYTWMLRLTHVAEALTRRGYRDDADVEVRLRVVDPIIDGNDGPLSLRVENGRAKVESATDAERARRPAASSDRSSSLTPRRHRSRSSGRWWRTRCRAGRGRGSSAGRRRPSRGARHRPAPGRAR